MKILRAAVAVGFSLLLITAAAETQPSVAAFVAPPQYRFLSLSPDGRRLATVANHDFVDHVALMDLETMHPSLGVSFDDAEPLAMWWKGNDRLLFLVRNYHSEYFFRAYNLTTGKVEHLNNFNRLALRIINPLPEDPEQVIVTSRTKTGASLQRFNIVTGKYTTIERNPGYVHEWFTNREGRAIAGFGSLDDAWFLITRPDPTAPWVKTPLGSGLMPDFMPMAVHDDQRRLVGWDFTTADTTRVILRDPHTGESEVIFHTPEADPLFLRLRNKDDPSRLRLVAHETDILRYTYLSADDEKLANLIDQALPGTHNDILSSSTDESKLLIRSDSDHHPGHYWLLDRRTGKVASLGHAKMEFANARLTPGQRFTFTSRDGLQLTGRIHSPAHGSSPPPAIVYLRTDLSAPSSPQFNFLIQLFASRGYAVLQIDQRGTVGFGRKFAAAGEKAFDSAMADDIADGVAHAASNGWLDPDRVAIYGNDQGGVLAVYALARNKARFAAWINVNTPMQPKGISPEKPLIDQLDRRQRIMIQKSYGMRVETIRIPIGGASYHYSWFRPDSVTWVEDIEVNVPLLGHSEWCVSPVALTQRMQIQAYGLKLEPTKQLSEIKVPSFHFYASQYLIDREGAKVPKLMEKSGAPCEFHRGTPELKAAVTVAGQNRQDHEENVRLYTAMLEFLDLHLAAKPKQ